MKRCLKCKTENAPEAEYCINCGFSLLQQAPPAETALEPPTRILRIIRLTPEVASVRRGERATMAARVDGELGTEVAWELEGSAAAFATVEPRSDGARIHLHPDHREAAWASPLEVRLLEFGEVSGLVTGTVEVLPEAEPELVAEPLPIEAPTEVHSAGVREARPRRESAGRPARPGLVAQLIALVACAVVVAVAYAVHRFIDYGGGWDSLWDAARHGGDGSSPLHPADFWTIVGPAVAALILTALSLLGSRRFAMSLVTLLGVLIVAQVLALGLSDRSLRERLSIGVPGSNSTHTPGAGFFVVLVAGFLLVLSAVMAVALREPAD